MRPLCNLISQWKHEEAGATAIEYCMIMALVFLAIVGGVTAFADANDGVYETIDTAIIGANS